MLPQIQHVDRKRMAIIWTQIFIARPTDQREGGQLCSDLPTGTIFLLKKYFAICQTWQLIIILIV